MKILLIANFSDPRCGFRNVADQMVTAFRRTPHEIGVFDGTYPEVYERHQQNVPAFFPPDVETYDVVHLIWNAMTMNHYSGAPWADLKHPVVSWWDGGPSDASCPFIDHMQIKWSDYPRDGYHYLPYPVPDWVTDLPAPDPVFTVGTSSVRGDGVAEARAICEARGWAMNLPTPGAWLSIEDEIRRLARSTVNVCWYHTSGVWRNRASAPSMMIASRRPLLVNRDHLVAHLWDYPDVYVGGGPHDGGGMATYLDIFEPHYRWGMIATPDTAFREMSWTWACGRFLEVWGAR